MHNGLPVRGRACRAPVMCFREEAIPKAFGPFDFAQSLP
jgi:hypothetical protein